MSCPQLPASLRRCAVPAPAREFCRGTERRGARSPGRRSLANNMVVGVSTGFTKRMEMIGTGYRASVAGKELTLNVGYSKPRVLHIPESIKVTVSLEERHGVAHAWFPRARTGRPACIVN